jgi:hypothetical protein
MNELMAPGTDVSCQFPQSAASANMQALTIAFPETRPSLIILCISLYSSCSYMRRHTSMRLMRTSMAK